MRVTAGGQRAAPSRRLGMPGALARASGLAKGWRGALAEKDGSNESEIEQTVVAFDVTLKTPTSQQGTAAFCAHLEAGAPLGFEETPQASGLAAAGFFFIWQAEPARRNPN